MSEGFRSHHTATWLPSGGPPDGTTFLSLLTLLPMLALVGVVLGPSNASQKNAASPPAHRVLAVQPGPTFFGMHDTSRKSLSRPGVESIRLWDTGTAWNQIEMSKGPPYHWTTLDQYVTAAQQRHVDVTLVLGMTPSFYGSMSQATAGAPPASPATTMPKDVGAYQSYVRAVMGRYRNWNGRRGIAAYQVWNEANVPDYWTGSPADMARLVQAAWEVRNEVDPGALLVGPPMVARLPSQQQWIRDFYRQRVGGRPVWQYLDAAAFNLYPRAVVSGHPGGPEDSMALLTQVRSILAADGVKATLPLWDTEINYGLIGGPSHPPAAPIPDSLQVAYVMRTYLLSAAQGLKRVYWYRYDLPNLRPGARPVANTLLTYPGNPGETLTPAGRAFIRIQDWMRGGTLVGTKGQRPCAADRHGTYTCVMKYRNGYGRIYWNPRSSAKVPLVRSASSAVDDNGHSRRVKGGSRLKVGYRPVMVRSRS